MARTLGAILVSVLAAAGQGIPKFPLAAGDLQIGGRAEPNRFINAVGERAGIWGFENGRVEAWVYPLKIFRDFHLAFELEGWPGVFEGDSLASSVRVFPHMVQLVYAAERFSVTETFFVPRNEPGGLILLDVKAPAPVRVLARFRPQLDLMWPAGFGGQTSEWDGEKRWVRESEPGERFSAVIGSPAAVASNAVGYRPYLTDREPYDTLELRITPDEAKRSFIPIVIAGGIRGVYDEATTYRKLLADLPRLYAEAREHYEQLEARGSQFETPDPEVNAGLRWARVSLDQLKVSNPQLGTSYVSGYGSSGTGTRPMYAWFFDEPEVAAWSQLPFGQFDAVRLSFEFMRKHQRSDGRILHELPQSAAYIDWYKDYPYAYIHPDSPLWYILSAHHVYRFSGDREFLTSSWDSIRKAYGAMVALLDPADALPRIPPGEWGSMEAVRFSKDSAMAAEWIAALRALQDLAGSMGDIALAREARLRESTATASLEREFWDPQLNYYDYGVDESGRRLRFLNPMVGYSAWFGSLPDGRARTVLERLATGAFLADWSQRNMPLDDPRYAEGSYQVGSAWPFLTAGPLLGHYRYHNAIEAYTIWRAMLSLRHADERGAMPEALSGTYYRLLDRGVPHQMFSEHAFVPPFIYGILGLALDVPARRLRLAPQLPPDWPSVRVRRFPYGKDQIEVLLSNAPGEFTAELRNPSADPVQVEFAPALPAGAEILEAVVDGKPVRYTQTDNDADRQVAVGFSLRERAAVKIRYRGGVTALVESQPVLEGETSRNLRVLRAGYEDGRFRFLVEGLPEQAYRVRLYTPWRAEPVSASRLLSSGERFHTVELRAPQASNGNPDRAGYVRWESVIALHIDAAR